MHGPSCHVVDMCKCPYVPAFLRRTNDKYVRHCHARSDTYVHMYPTYLGTYVIHPACPRTTPDPCSALHIVPSRGIKAAARPSETSLNVGDGVDDGSTTNMSELMEGSDGNEPSCPLSNGDDGDAPLNSPAPVPSEPDESRYCRPYCT